jgi:hypothetical protein
MRELRRWLTTGLAVLAVVCLTSGVARAYVTPAAAPEIDPGMLPSALALLGGAALIVKSRLRSK